MHRLVYLSRLGVSVRIRFFSNIILGHFSGHIVYNMFEFKKSDYGRLIYKEGQKASNIDIPLTCQQDSVIRKKVERCLSDILDFIVKSIEINKNSAVIGVAVSSVSTINVIQKVAPTIQLPITLPIEASKIPELVINSKKFYQFFFDQLDFSSTPNNIPSNLPDL